MPAENFVCTSLSDKSAVHDGGNSIPSAVIHGFLFAPEGMAGENASKEIFEKSGFMSVPVRLQTRSTRASRCCGRAIQENMRRKMDQMFYRAGPRSEEHTSELQSREKIVCRLLLEKKNIMPVVSPSGIVDNT